VGAAVNPVVDGLSGEPEFKHTPARVEPFPVEWYGFLLTRRDLETPDVTWWTRISGVHCTRYELAGREIPQDWSAWGRRLFGAPQSGHEDEYLELEEPSEGVYRAAHLVGDRLESCLYVATRADLSGRGPLANLFAVEMLTEVQRMALLTGGAVTEDVGPIVCSCFGVGRDTIRRVIAEHGLSAPHQISSRLRAGTNCGSCLPEIKALLGSVHGGAADLAMVDDAGVRPNRIPVSTSTGLPSLT
jgi:assimilatory nitrate reductase catalytic subunit